MYIKLTHGWQIGRTVTCQNCKFPYTKMAHVSWKKTHTNPHSWRILCKSAKVLQFYNSIWVVHHSLDSHRKRGDHFFLQPNFLSESFYVMYMRMVLCIYSWPEKFKSIALSIRIYLNKHRRALYRATR